MVRGRVWRRFRPRQVPAQSVPAGDLFAQATDLVRQYLAEGHDRLEVAVDAAVEAATADPSSVRLLASLIVQAPRSARAQAQMDKHPRGYHGQHERLYQLIDFNDTFVATVLSLPESELPAFTVKLRQACDTMCRQVKGRTFTDEQYQAITHGLSREIAVYRGALREGLRAEMASRADDAFGIDMRIIDDQAGRYINLDVKTTSAFHFRLLDLVREGRLAPHDQIDAETKGYWEIVHRRDDRHTKIILLRASQDELGKIVDFSFERSELLGRRLRRILELRSIAVR